MKQQLSDFGFNVVKWDNTGAVNKTMNLILHSRAKHIDIEHHFISDSVHNGDVNFSFLIQIII